jgi:hypothetical protein
MRMVGLIYCLLHEKGYCRQHTPNKDHVRFVVAGRRVGFGARCLRGMGSGWARTSIVEKLHVASDQCLVLAEQKMCRFPGCLGETTPSLGRPHVGLACLPLNR